MSQPLIRLGTTAIDIHANNRPLQEVWMNEQHHGGRLWRGALIVPGFPSGCTTAS